MAAVTQERDGESLRSAHTAASRCRFSLEGFTRLRYWLAASPILNSDVSTYYFGAEQTGRIILQAVPVPKAWPMTRLSASSWTIAQSLLWFVVLRDANKEGHRRNRNQPQPLSRTSYGGHGYGMTVDTSFEKALSLPLASTAVVT
jgi:hypothetical protein